MSQSGFMMDARRLTKTALDVNSKLSLRIQQSADDNNTWLGFIEDSRATHEDNLGALYYVVAVLFIYGLSIVMMIASHIRKNKQDSQLRTYLKEMAKLRKDDRRDKVLSKITDIAKRRQQQEEMRRIQARLQDGTADSSEAESEASQLIMKKDINEDNTDSVFLSPGYCVTPDSRTPSPSDSLCSRPVKICSPSFHDYRRWGKSNSRSISVQDYKSVKVHERPPFSDHRSVLTSANGRSPNQSDFHLSPLCELERSSTVHVSYPFRWTKSRTHSHGDAKLKKNSQKKQPKNLSELKLNLPANFLIVDEDGVL